MLELGVRLLRVLLERKRVVGLLVDPEPCASAELSRADLIMTVGIKQNMWGNLKRTVTRLGASQSRRQS